MQSTSDQLQNFCSESALIKTYHSSACQPSSNGVITPKFIGSQPVKPVAKPSAVVGFRPPVIDQKTAQNLQAFKFQLLKQALVNEMKKREALAENIRQSNIRNLKMRLYQIAARPGAKENLVIREPAPDTDFTQWGERIYSPSEIDQIIINSNLVTKAPVPIQQEPQKTWFSSRIEYLLSAAKQVDLGDYSTASVTAVTFRKTSQDLDATMPKALLINSEDPDMVEYTTESTSDEKLTQYMDQAESLQNKYIGCLSVSERSSRILKYKAKIFLRRVKCPISKKFSGRSKVATQKLRVNGKFVKASAIATS